MKLHYLGVRRIFKERDSPDYVGSFVDNLVERALVANMTAHSRVRRGLVCYLHYGLLVRMANKNDGTSAVFAEVPILARVLFQWFSTFWTIGHLQIPSWIAREDEVKML